MSRQSGHLLVVDDSRINRIKLSRILLAQGHNVTVAEDGRQALKYLYEQAFDLVLLDIVMPEMDGYQVLEYMKCSEALRDIPVIVISSIDELDSIVRCIEMGAEDYLPKQFDPVLLQARINASLEKKRLRDAVNQQFAILRDVFGKYVPESVVTAIVESQGNLEPRQTIATILFTDIESFTTTCEGMLPEQIFQMLNEYFPTIIETITHYGGVINQFYGDSVFATFNVPLEDPDHADLAVMAAYEICQLMKDKTFAGVPLHTRIGISTGDVVAGNVGSGNRFHYTVYGEAVNVASRLEQLNKEYGTTVLLSETTVNALKEHFPIESIGAIAVRGKHEPIEVFKFNL